jgi:CRP-like cAMP-binding protein
MTTGIRAKRGPQSPACETQGHSCGGSPRSGADPLLRESALFRLLGPERAESLRPTIRIAGFDTGEFLYHEGSQGHCLFAVRRGEIRTVRSHPSGRLIVLERCVAGDLFGLAALAGVTLHGESAQALCPGEAWRLPRRVVKTLLEEDPAVARALLAIVAQRLQHAQDRLCSFAADDVSARLARTLLATPPHERIETTRRSLGESAGTSVETAIRVLRRFERAGWIEGGIGWLRVLDRSALDRVIRGILRAENSPD